MSGIFEGLGLTIDQPAKLIIRHRDSGEPLVDENGKEAFIEVLSAESQAARDYERRLLNARLARRQGARLTAEQVEEEQGRRFAALVRSWHLVNLDGKAMDVPLTEQNAAKLFSQPSWLKEQLEAFLYNASNFVKGSSTN